MVVFQGTPPPLSYVVGRGVGGVGCDGGDTAGDQAVGWRPNIDATHAARGGPFSTQTGVRRGGGAGGAGPTCWRQVGTVVLASSGAVGGRFWVSGRAASLVVLDRRGSRRLLVLVSRKTTKQARAGSQVADAVVVR